MIDATRFRARPHEVVETMAAQLGLRYSADLLRWRPSPTTELSGLRQGVDPFFERVLRSGGVEPPQEPIPELSDFPTEGRFREHVAESCDAYRELRLEAIAT